MEFGPKTFLLLAVLWIVGGNLLAWYFQIHVRAPFGFCSGYGC